MCVTLLSTCKSFEGLIATIQRNAFRNWAGLRQTQVIIFGNEKGVREATEEFGFTHISEIEQGPQGHPLIPAMFGMAEEIHPAPVYLFTNADMLYFGIEDALDHLVENLPEFLMVGLRRDVEVVEKLTFDGNWTTSLLKQGKYHPPCGVDFFGFTSDLWVSIPPFQVGYVGFDNWLVRHALKQGTPVVNVTDVVEAFHQRHPARTSGRRPGDLYNVEFFEEDHGRFKGWVTHADWILTK